jgi:cobalamin biosynthesis Mg chelatase CobN
VIVLVTALELTVAAQAPEAPNAPNANANTNTNTNRRPTRAPDRLIGASTTPATEPSIQRPSHSDGNATSDATLTQPPQQHKQTPSPTWSSPGFVDILDLPLN